MDQDQQEKMHRLADAIAATTPAFQAMVKAITEAAAQIAASIDRIRHTLQGAHVCQWREAGAFDVCAHGYVVRASGKALMHNGKKPRR